MREGALGIGLCSGQAIEQVGDARRGEIAARTRAGRVEFRFSDSGFGRCCFAFRLVCKCTAAGHDLDGS